MKKASLLFLIIAASVVLIGASSAVAFVEGNGPSTNGSGWGGASSYQNGVEMNGGRGNGGAKNGGRGNGGATNGGRGNGRHQNGAGQVKGGDFIKSCRIGSSGLQLNAIILPEK